MPELPGLTHSAPYWCFSAERPEGLVPPLPLQPRTFPRSAASPGGERAPPAGPRGPGTRPAVLATAGLPGWEEGARCPRPWQPRGPGEGWALSVPAASQHGRRSWQRPQQRPFACSPGAGTPRQGSAAPRPPAAPPCLLRPRLRPRGAGSSRLSRSTGGRSRGAALRAMGGAHSQTPRGREPAGERPPRPRETA